MAQPPNPLALLPGQPGWLSWLLPTISDAEHFQLRRLRDRALSVTECREGVKRVLKGDASRLITRY